MANYIDILPKLDPSTATISRDFLCTECGKSGIDNPMVDKPSLIGYCETDNGYMMVVECPHCFEKYRYHGTVCDKNDIGEFENAIQCQILARYFSNSEELEKEIKRLRI